MNRKRALSATICALVMFALLLAAPVNAAGQESTDMARTEGTRSPRAFAPADMVLNFQDGEAGHATLNLKDVPLEDFLGLVSRRTGKKFVLKPSVKDTRISAFLPDVPVDQALFAVLQANDLAYQQYGEDIILIGKRGELAGAAEEAQKPGEEEELPPLETEIIRLKFLDAADVKATLEPLLSDRGTLQVVKQSGFIGWGFAAGAGRAASGAGSAGGGGEGDAASGFGYRGRDREGYRQEVRSQIVVVSDVAEKVELIRSLVNALDTRPKQILISANIVEVNRDKLHDLGVSWGTGRTGAETEDIGSTDPWGSSVEFRGNFLGGLVSPGNFDPESGMSGSFPFDAGSTFMFRKVGGSEFEVILHALEEKADANVLSAPKLLTLDNREATILVGNKFPILETDTTGTEVTQITTSLDYYENIGIQLSVVPQIQQDKYINMIVHPVVSDQSGVVAARGTGGEVLAEYPIIDTRETETEIMIEDGQTIVLGGLLKNVDSENVASVPLLGDIPLLGALFRRTTRDTQTIDLIIFLSAEIIAAPGEATEERARGMAMADEVPVRSLLKRADRLRERGDYREALQTLRDLGDPHSLQLTPGTRSDLVQQLEQLQELAAKQNQQAG